jgi:hypothetical protein
MLRTVFIFIQKIIPWSFTWEFHRIELIGIKTLIKQKKRENPISIIYNLSIYLISMLSIFLTLKTNNNEKPVGGNENCK